MFQKSRNATDSDDDKQLTFMTNIIKQWCNDIDEDNIQDDYQSDSDDEAAPASILGNRSVSEVVADWDNRRKGLHIAELLPAKPDVRKRCIACRIQTRMICRSCKVYCCVGSADSNCFNI